MFKSGRSAAELFIPVDSDNPPIAFIHSNLCCSLSCRRFIRETGGILVFRNTSSAPAPRMTVRNATFPSTVPFTEPVPVAVQQPSATTVSILLPCTVSAVWVRSNTTVWVTSGSRISSRSNFPKNDVLTESSPSFCSDSTIKAVTPPATAATLNPIAARVLPLNPLSF